MVGCLLLEFSKELVDVGCCVVTGGSSTEYDFDSSLCWGIDIASLSAAERYGLVPVVEVLLLLSKLFRDVWLLQPR